MTKVDSIRREVHRLVKLQPFRPFALVLESGQRVLVGHPENIAYSTDTKKNKRGHDEFYLFSGDLRIFSTFSSVSGIVLVDDGELGG